VFGDAHIPSRRDSIPPDFYDHIESAVYDLALVTGDLVREQAMRDAMPDIPKSLIVIGNMDYGSSYRHHERIQIDDFDFLLLHGTQLRPRGSNKQLLEIVEEVGADAAIHGHTHKSAIDLLNGKLLLNPGTVSGATGGSFGRTDASFIELEIISNSLLVKLHRTDWYVTRTSELRYEKQADGIVSLQ
jgi:putative phosphoesterase